MSLAKTDRWTDGRTAAKIVKVSNNKIKCGKEEK
jgi:hypothetical protein